MVRDSASVRLTRRQFTAGSLVAALVTSGGVILARESTPVATSAPSATPGSTPLASPVASPVAVTNSPVAMIFEDMRFNPREVTIPADTDITFNFSNNGYLAHDFAMDSPRKFSGVLRFGQTASMVLNLPAGTYTFYCTQIGHRAAGMQGTLTVV